MPYPKLILTTLAVLFGAVVFYTLYRSSTPSPEDRAHAEQLFVYEVFPILQEKCFACHGEDPKKVEGDFDIRSLDGMLAGGESGHPALVPGQPDKSPLYLATTWQNSDLEMPPKENDRLSETQIAQVRKWIEHGAPWPDDERQSVIRATTEWTYSDGIPVKTSGARSATWANRRYKPEDLWAFYPVQSYEVPSSSEAGEAVHPVDAFIRRQLNDNELSAAEPADRRTLIRRATFDLIGLPPTEAETQAFLDDRSPDAFAKVVDRLLASPHYGEQWGRHWLDVVRYADTDGFSNDYERPNAWRYRDYVIRSFNDDKPYDQFIREQIAGDELAPDDPEMRVATGFLRMGPWEHTAMSVAAETRQFFLDDVTNSVGETFLSIPLRCASCHDHKFDPIPTKDYYRMQAVFAPVQFAEREAAYLASENQQGFDEGRQRLQRLLQQTEREADVLQKKEERAARQWMEQRGLRYRIRQERIELPEDQRPPRFYGLTNQDLGYRKVLQKRLQTLRRKLGRYEPRAFSVYNGPAVKNPDSSRPMRMPDSLSGDLPATFILAGGSVYAPDEEVTPGVLSAIQSLGEEEAPATDSVPPTMNGRRSALAHWLADQDNPITTRSIVNRVWQYHFGQGLAGNANNFGVMGKKPTHPELLDWLTEYFLAHDWSIKALHRLIMSSQTYQQASNHPALQEIQEKDSDNTLLAYFPARRLSAEELRDAMLMTSGELNLTLGGLPVKPEINREVALQPRHIMGSIAPAHQPSRTPAERHRRTIYTYRYRGMPNPMLEVFNRPSADISCERRTPSTVTPQVFTLFNGQDSHDRALAMAQRIEKETSNTEQQVRQAIALAWNREATPDELQQSLQYLDTMLVYHRQNPPVAQSYPTHIERTMFEEMTGEEFTYTEHLDRYENYVPDTKPWDVEPDTRALANLCLVLFNANEFVYVY